MLSPFLQTSLPSADTEKSFKLMKRTLTQHLPRSVLLWQPSLLPANEETIFEVQKVLPVHCTHPGSVFLQFFRPIREGGQVPQYHPLIEAR